MSFTDLHSHILPGMDDGARDPAESAKMLRAELEMGVERIALTSHFRIDRESPEAFADRRERAWEALMAELENNEKTACAPVLKKAAEVTYFPGLVESDLSKLCIEGTKTVLVELPMGAEPFRFDETICGLRLRGYDPILAHIERCDKLISDPSRIYELVENGVYIQINAGTLLSRGRSAAFCLDLIRWGLVHVIASDAHGPESRAPNLGRAVEYIEKKLGKGAYDALEAVSAGLFAGESPEAPYPYCPRKVLGRWR